MRVRVWGAPDAFYLAAIPDASSAEEQVRGALSSGVQAEVQATRQLSKDELAGLDHGEIALQPPAAAGV